MLNNHVITWLRNRLYVANTRSIHTEKSRVQRMLIKELDRQFS